MSGQHAFGSAPGAIMAPEAVLLPDGEVFGRRALRLRELAGTVEPLADFLAFMARLAQVQQQLLEREPLWRPTPGAFDLALEHGMPPLGVRALRGDVPWQPELFALLDALELHVGQRQRRLLATLRGQTPAQLEALADDVFEGRSGADEQRALLPLVAAALQLVWVRLAANLPRPPRRAEPESRGLCPCCGSPPVAGVIHGEPRRSGVRYLHCALCACEWHLERVTCSLCGAGGKMLYLELDDAQGRPVLPVRAEACGECHGYLKLVQRDLHGRAEPVADDLASLALDLLLAEQGEYLRGGCNLLLVSGE